MKRRAVLLSLAAFLLLAGVALALAPPPAPQIDWWVISAGGGHAEAGVYTLEATIGQPVVGRVVNSTYELCAGFRCDVTVAHKTYLPLIRKSD
ncbi:MAG: hypothetical protein D6791_12260 [Chloroflexi bacterium]|nr:MAG: hypothetical protein D6791_12260 [Chloroflexota bacterium]